MITAKKYQAVVKKTVQMMKRAGIVITPEERARVEVADFGLGELEKTGLEILTYVNTERVCAKEIIMFPRQTCPEHRHPTVDGRAGTKLKQAAGIRRDDGLSAGGLRVAHFFRE